MDCHNIHMLFHSGVYCWFILLLTQALISCIRVLLSGVLWCITCSFFHCSCSHSSYLTLNTICLSYINMFIYQQDVAHREPTNIGCHDWGVTQSLSLQECYIRQIFEHKHREIYRKIMEFVSLNMMSWNWHFWSGLILKWKGMQILKIKLSKVVCWDFFVGIGCVIGDWFAAVEKLAIHIQGKHFYHRMSSSISENLYC